MGGTFLGIAITGATALIAWLTFHFGKAKGEPVQTTQEQRVPSDDPAVNTTESGTPIAQNTAAEQTTAIATLSREPSGSEQGQVFQGFEDYRTEHTMTTDLLSLATRIPEIGTSERDNAAGSGIGPASILPWSGDYQGGPVE